jgi:hypothetical protein
LFRLVTGLEADLFRPPVVKGRDWDNRQVIHLHGVRKFRRRVGQPLQEGEKIDALSALPQAVQDGLGIVQKQEFFAIDPRQANQLSLDLDVPFANFNQVLHECLFLLVLDARFGKAHDGAARSGSNRPNAGMTFQENSRAALFLR